MRTLDLPVMINGMFQTLTIAHIKRGNLFDCPLFFIGGSDEMRTPDLPVMIDGTFQTLNITHSKGDNLLGYPPFITGGSDET